MTKKIGYLDRKKLLETQRGGASNTELKKEFSIKDNRTLARHLLLAEQEEQLRTVQIGIIKEAIEKHHEDIRDLLKQWKANMKTLRPDEIYPSVVIPNMDLKKDPIFPCLKNHLPSLTLWSTHSNYEKFLNELFERCLDMRQKVAKDVGKLAGVISVTENVAQPILRIISDSESDTGTKPFTFKTHSPNKTQDKTIIIADDIEVFVISGQTNVSAVEKRYQQYADKLITSETGRQLSATYHELKDELEPKINKLLQEILHRRDYIMNTCRLCPGQPKLLRR